MISTTDIINKLGPEAIQSLCEVGESSVRAAKRDGQFPASWFNEIDKACGKRGIPCPRELFAFKGAAIVNHRLPHGPTTPTIQPPATKRKRGGRG